MRVFNGLAMAGMVALGAVTAVGRPVAEMLAAETTGPAGATEATAAGPVADVTPAAPPPVTIPAAATPVIAPPVTGAADAIVPPIRRVRPRTPPPTTVERPARAPATGRAAPKDKAATAGKAATKGPGDAARRTVATGRRPTPTCGPRERLDAKRQSCVPRGAGVVATRTPRT
jgi:hypothetical protein